MDIESGRSTNTEPALNERESDAAAYKSVKPTSARNELPVLDGSPRSARKGIINTDLDSRPDVHITAKDKERREQETLLAERDKSHAIKNRPELVDDFDEVSRPVYESPTVRIRTGTLNWFDEFSRSQQNTNGLLDFMKNAKDHIENKTSPWFWIFGSTLIFLYAFSMLIVGSVNARHCEAQPNIAVYMIVAGLFTMIKFGLILFVQIARLLKKDLPPWIDSWPFKIVEAVLTLFLVIWFITGCVWVYGNYEKIEYNELTEQFLLGQLYYCNSGLYRFAFWTLTLTIIVATIVVLGAVALLMYIKYRNIKNMESKT